jgi:two-component sensor histidine kinase
MMLTAGESANRAASILSSASTLLDVIDAFIGRNACTDQLNKTLDLLPQFSTMAIVDADGRVRCSTLAEAEGMATADRDWFRELRSSDADFVQSAANFGTITKLWMITSAKRRRNPDGSFAGALALSAPVESLIYRLDRTDIPEGSEIAVADQSGRVFGSRYWETLEPEIVQVLNQGDGGFFHMQSRSGDRDMAVVPMAQSKFFSVLSSPRLAPIALENVSAFGNFALPLLAWLLALVTAWLATDRLVLRWLDYLRRIAGLYASGKLSVQPLRAKRAAPGEINILADTLEEMAVRVRDRTTRLETAVLARDAAMKEIHHRVKNNLQIINSLLSLQSRKVKDPAAIAVLDDARARINALSLIHRSLYEHNDIRSVETRSFFGDLAMQLDQALGAEDQKIRIDSSIDDDTIDADVAVPLALFTAEAVTNAVKHAFPVGRGVHGGRVLVSYRLAERETVLCVEDDGIGGGEIIGGSGLGSTLMTAFAKQVHGVLEEEPVKSGGRLVRIRMHRVNGVTGAMPPAGQSGAGNRQDGESHK